MEHQPDLLNEQLLKDVGNIARVTSTDGKVASYIPELSRMSAELFSLSCQPVCAEIIETGDVGQFFTMQSISKIFSLAFAIEKFGRENVFRHAGMEASADSFNSLMRIEMTSSKPSNPFMNAGAIAVCSLICKAYRSEALGMVADFLKVITGEYNGFDENVFLSEKNSADRNRALAYFMKSMGLLHGDVEEILDLYFTLCSLRCTSGTLARAARKGDRLHAARTYEHMRSVQRIRIVCGQGRASGKKRRFRRHNGGSPRPYGDRSVFAGTQR